MTFPGYHLDMQSWYNTKISQQWDNYKDIMKNLHSQETSLQSFIVFKNVSVKLFTNCKGCKQLDKNTDKI